MMTPTCPVEQQHRRRDFHKEIAACVRAYVDASIAAGRCLDVNAHVYGFFPSESTMILRAASRAGDNIRALNEDNTSRMKLLARPTTPSPGRRAIEFTHQFYAYDRAKIVERIDVLAMHPVRRGLL
jgi:hypothetical protein